jgi:protein gp37
VTEADKEAVSRISAAEAGMGEKTGIQWTEHTWNPWQGCQKVSPGCDHCYMFRDKKRYGQNPELVVLSSAQTFNKPLRWNREAKAAGEVRRVFVASWADFFSAEADEWRPRAWDVIRQCDSLVFQVLTKRHGRIAAHLPPDWGTGYPNVWLGVSAENREWFDRRVGALRKVPAARRFVSYEPALGSIEGASAEGIDWVIVGGESAPARPFDVQWARDTIAMCRRDGAAPFVKQMGSVPVLDGAPLKLRDPHGGEMDEWPEDVRVREFPAA